MIKPGKASVDLGFRDQEATVGDHIAYFWETRADFLRGVDFLAHGLRTGEHGVVFGFEEANTDVISALKEKGLDTEALAADGQLTVVGGMTAGDAMLASIGGVFQKAIDDGCSLIRLLGNIGWGRSGWPSEGEILAFEAKVTGAAKAFPSVVVCMYDVNALPGKVMVHGALQTHPVTIVGNVVRENPYYVGVDEFLADLGQAG